MLCRRIGLRADGTPYATSEKAAAWLYYYSSLMRIFGLYSRNIHVLQVFDVSYNPDHCQRLCYSLTSTQLPPRFHLTISCSSRISPRTGALLAACSRKYRVYHQGQYFHVSVFKLGVSGLELSTSFLRYCIDSRHHDLRRPTPCAFIPLRSHSTGTTTASNIAPHPGTGEV